MKVIINGRPLIKPFTGMGQYAKYMVHELSKHFPENEYIFVVPEDIEENFKGFFGKNVKFEYIPEKVPGSSGLKKTWWEQKAVPSFMLKEGCDIAFFPYPANPWDSSFYKKGIKVACTVHDAIPWKNQAYRNRIMSKIYHGKTRKNLKKSDLVMTVSKYSKRDIHKYTGINEEDIKVIYNDAGYEYKVKKSPGFVDKVLKGYGLKRHEYFIYCGGFDVRKNVTHLVEEYEIYAKKMGGKAFKLVLVGGKVFDSGLYDSFDVVEGKCGEIVETGFLDDLELSALYQASCAYVSATKEEGFNIPLLEAANSGTALILSNIDVHLEVANKMGVFADNDIEGDFAKKMESMMNERLRDEAIEESGQIANNYLWERSAMRLNYLFENLLK